MKIRALAPIGTSHASYALGDVMDWEDDADAQRLIDAGFAEVVDTASAPAKPKATTRKKKTAKAVGA